MARLRAQRYALPAVFAEERPLPLYGQSKLKIALGLDLGTSCGYSLTVFDPKKPFKIDGQMTYAGQWDLSAGPYDSGGIRFVKLRHFLLAADPAVIFYEMVRYSPPEKVTKFNAAGLLARAATSMEFLGALRGIVVEWAEEFDRPCTGLSIQHIKKRATGKGNANKEAVIEAANAAFGADLEVAGHESAGTDNVADAMWVLALGLEQFGDGITSGKVEDGTEKSDESTGGGPAGS